MLNDLCMRRKIHHLNETSRAGASGEVSDGLKFGLVYEDEIVECTPCNASHHYKFYVHMSEALPQLSCAPRSSHNMRYSTDGDNHVNSGMQSTKTAVMQSTDQSSVF